MLYTIIILLFKCLLHEVTPKTDFKWTPHQDHHSRPLFISYLLQCSFKKSFFNLVEWCFIYYAVRTGHHLSHLKNEL